MDQPLVTDKSVYELYLAPEQKNGKRMNGFDLEMHLKKENLLDRTYSIDDDVVRGWVDNPSTFPEEFKEKVILLWKTVLSDGRHVAYVIGVNGRVGLGLGLGLEHDLDRRNYTLLKV